MIDKLHFKNISKQYGIYLIAIVVFVLIAFIYCKPVLSGKTLNATDEVLATTALQESARYHQETGDYTWWTGSMFSGMPNYQIGGGGTVGQVNWLKPLQAIFSMGHGPVWTLILYFICFFILLRCFDVKPWLSIVGSLAIAFSSYFFVIIAAGHGNKTITIALISVVIGAFYLLFRKHKYGLGAILTMVFVSMGYSSHPQMAYYLYMMIGLLWIAELILHIKEKKYKQLIIATVIFVGATALGIGTRSSKVFTNAEYVKETMRGGHSEIVRDTIQSGSTNTSNGLDLSYATQWSYGIDETMTFLIPGFMGGSSSYALGTDSNLYKEFVKRQISINETKAFCQVTPMYWGEQPSTAGNVYMGAIVCFLFILGLIVVNGPYKWALLIATILSTALAWGHNFQWLTELFFKYFPLYSKFRAVSSILVVAEIAMPLLGFIALSQIIEGKIEKKKLLKGMYISGGITGGLCLFFALFGGVLFDFQSSFDSRLIPQMPDWLYTSLINERSLLLKSDSIRSLIFIALAFTLIWIFVKGKLRKGWLIAILGVLIIADMWPVDKRYFNDSFFTTHSKKSQENYQITAYEKALLQDKDPNFRVFNLTTNTFNENRTSLYLKSIGGYSAVKLRRYQDLIDEHLSKGHMSVINMLNTKYFIVPDENGMPAPKYNPTAMGNAWFVDNVVIVDNATEESDALTSINLNNTAVLDKSFAGFVSDFQPGHDYLARVKLTNYTPKALDYESTSSKDGIIVFSEIYYPYGWKASIDGKPVEHFRVNYLLRALNVPAGDHHIHFVFDPDSVRKGNTLAGICCILMYISIFGVIVWAIFRRFRKQKVSNDSNELSK